MTFRLLIMKNVYDTPSMSSVFANKKQFGRKYAILSRGCNHLTINQL